MDISAQNLGDEIFDLLGFQGRKPECTFNDGGGCLLEVKPQTGEVFVDLNRGISTPFIELGK